MTADADARRSAVMFWGVGSAFVGVAVLLVYAPEVLLLTFAGALLGTSLRGAAEWLARLCRWCTTVALGVTIVLVIAAATGLALWVVPRLLAQAGEVRGELVGAIAVAREQLAKHGIDAPSPDTHALEGYARHAAGMLATGIGLLASSVYVAFLAVYLAFSPAIYRRGLLAIAPRQHRGMVDKLIGACSHTLRRWMVGRMISMVAVGVLTALGLWALGVPLPITLALLAALLDFVPNVGPIVSGIPALLLAAPLGLEIVLLVGALYLAINLLDGYVLTPFVQRRAVETPPALVLAGQLLAGALFGLLGVMLATPLVAVVLVAVRTARQAPASTR